MSLQPEIVARALANQPPSDIAKALGCRRATVYDYIWKARASGVDIPYFRTGKPKGSMRVCLSPQVRAALLPHADRRGLDPQELALALLQCVIDAGLIDAVLDDQPVEAAA